LALLVRTWNVFHGNAKPPERRAFLDEMVRLASADRPDVLCLQEVPIWALRHLDRWSGMQAFGAVAARPRLGSPELGRAITELHHGLFRSAFTGQANAILVAGTLGAGEHRILVLNPREFRRALELRLGARLAWARERRVCQALRLGLPGARTALVANLHATSYARDRRLASAELRRAADFAAGLARRDEPLVLAGDFNLTAATSPTLRDLVAAGFSAAGPGIDHVLVRGLEVVEGATVWPPERRTVSGRLLSDHAPVEVRIA
jgi:endonuclease/exonuclease/phosphatase family metal-dependent hydrolase